MSSKNSMSALFSIRLTSIRIFVRLIAMGGLILLPQSGLQLFAATPDTPARIVGLVLTWQQDPSTTMTIDWHTEAHGTPSSMQYRRYASGEDWQSVSGEILAFPFSDRLIHRVELTGLDPDTEYSFRFSAHSPPRKFRTMPQHNYRPIRFAVGGDVRHTMEMMDRTNRRAAEYNPDFIVWGGDLAYADGREDRLYRWYEFMESMKNSLVTADGRVIPVIAGIGNHEVRGGYYRNDDRREGMPPYRQDDISRELIAPYYYRLFAFPGQPGYGVLDFGNYMSILLLDTDHSNPVDGIQTEWLERVLSERQHVPHIFPNYHVPAYPSVRSPHGGTQTRIREFWVPLFERFPVKVVFENHDHVYKRTYPLRNGAVDPDGIVYMGDGAWGVSTRAVLASEDGWYLKRTSSERHFILGTIHGSLQHFLVVNEDGEIIDEYPRTSHTEREQRRFAAPWNPEPEEESP